MLGESYRKQGPGCGDARSDYADARPAPATRHIAPHGATFRASVLQNEPDDVRKPNEPTVAAPSSPDLVMPQQVTPAVSRTQERKYDVRTQS